MSTLASMLFTPMDTRFGSVNETKLQTEFSPRELYPNRTRGVLKLNRFVKVFDIIKEYRNKLVFRFYQNEEGENITQVNIFEKEHPEHPWAQACFEDAGSSFLVYPQKSWTKSLFAIYILASAAYGGLSYTTDLLCKAEEKENPFLLSDTFYFEMKDKMGIVPTKIGVSLYETPMNSSHYKLSKQFTYDGSQDLKNKAILDIMSAVSHSTTVSKSCSDDSLLGRCINGDFIIEHEWDEEAKSLIQPLSSLEKMQITGSFERALKVMHSILANPDKRQPFQALFYGPPRTGKSYTAKALGTALGLPVYVVPMKPHSEEDTFEGMTKVHEGKWDFVPTPFLKGFKNGGLVILEEFNLADPGVLQGALSQALEEPYLLLEDSITPVKRHPLCCIIGTMNPEVAGSKSQNDAFMSRLRHQFEIQEPDKENILKQLQGKFPEANPKTTGKIYDEYRKAADYIVTNGGREYEMKLTIRHVEACIERVLEGEDWKSVTLDVFSSAIRIWGDFEMADLLEKALKGTR